MQGASAPVGDGASLTANDVIQCQKCPAPEFKDDRFLGRGQDRLFGFGPMGASVISTRPRHFRIVFAVRPYWLARRRIGAFAALRSARIRGVVRALL
jgi:hypothetical protein